MSARPGRARRHRPGPAVSPEDGGQAVGTVTAGGTISRPQPDRSRTGKLYRDRKRAKIAGVCAGLANYFGGRGLGCPLPCGHRAHIHAERRFSCLLDPVLRHESASGQRHTKRRSGSRGPQRSHVARSGVGRNAFPAGQPSQLAGRPDPGGIASAAYRDPRHIGAI